MTQQPPNYKIKGGQFNNDKTVNILTNIGLYSDAGELQILMVFRRVFIYIYIPIGRHNH